MVAVCFAACDDGVTQARRGARNGSSRELAEAARKCHAFDPIVRPEFAHRSPKIALHGLELKVQALALEDIFIKLTSTATAAPKAEI